MFRTSKVFGGIGERRGKKDVAIVTENVIKLI